ncbi:MAG: PIG-L family deacetylase [Acidobacteria bacterium]|nr:PIG-L family deacetylase [Acidobacteriota bacterium]
MRSLSSAIVAVLLALLLLGPASAQEPGNILVVTANSGDYMLGSGGTLIKFIQEGYDVYVAQMGNDEKITHGLSPAQARLANVEDGKAAAKLLGVSDTVYMGHKSGELMYVSSTEMRKQLFGLIRHYRPRKLFIPDPYVHYLDDTDPYQLGRVAEEAWGYSGGGTFAPELARVGLEPYGAPEVYFYSQQRPYRPGEGGEGNARMMSVDITATIEQKINAIELLRNRNQVYARTVRDRLAAAGRLTDLLDPFDDGAVRKLVRAYVEQFGRVVGAKYGYPAGEEFNYVGGGPELPPHVLQNAVPK